MKPENKSFVRWVILQTLYNARPIGAVESLIRSVVETVDSCSQLELRQELDYLRDRNVISIHDEHTGTWRAEIGRYGVDIVEYTVPVEPGIARPRRD